jgi:hypothetical protein
MKLSKNIEIDDSMIFYEGIYVGTLKSCEICLKYQTWYRYVSFSLLKKYEWLGKEILTELGQARVAATLELEQPNRFWPEVYPEKYDPAVWDKDRWVLEYEPKLKIILANQ